MADIIPEGAILKDQFISPTPVNSIQHEEIPEGAIPIEQFQEAENSFGTTPQVLTTAIEQGLSGATLGVSKGIETKLLGVPPENIEARERKNPGVSAVSNILGTGALLYGTGGLSALAEGANIAGRLGVAALEGAGIGGINELTDEWSQNKSLDAQKIAASTGIGALLGFAGGTLGESLIAIRQKRMGKTPTDKNAALPVSAEPLLKETEISPIIDSAQEFKGVRPTTYQDVVEKVNRAKANNEGIALPAQSSLDAALSRVSLQNTVNPLQRNSLSSQEARNIYQTFKEVPGDVGAMLSNYEGVQKAELVNKTLQTIRDINPKVEPISDPFKAGKFAIQQFEKQYQTEKKLLGPIFNNLEHLAFEGDLLPSAIFKMTEAVPGVSKMFNLNGLELEVAKKYKTTFGIDEATFKAVKQAFESLDGAENNLENLWNVRKGLSQHVDILSEGQGANEIRSLRSALMDLMQEGTGDRSIRDSFRRYAINEQKREVIEKVFGASAGAIERGQISKVSPELISDKIFKNTAAVDAAKNILNKDQFDSILANWISEYVSKFTDNGAFSANRFGNSFLKQNQNELNIAFSDNPALLQRLIDLNTITRILPDSQKGNPSGTAKTLLGALGNLELQHLTLDSIIAQIPKKVLKEVKKAATKSELNSALGQTSNDISQQNLLKKKVKDISDNLDKLIKGLFIGTSSQSRKGD